MKILFDTQEGYQFYLDRPYLSAEWFEENPNPPKIYGPDDCAYVNIWGVRDAIASWPHLTEDLARKMLKDCAEEVDNVVVDAWQYNIDQVEPYMEPPEIEEDEEEGEG